MLISIFSYSFDNLQHSSEVVSRTWTLLKATFISSPLLLLSPREIIRYASSRKTSHRGSCYLELPLPPSHGNPPDDLSNAPSPTRRNFHSKRSIQAHGSKNSAATECQTSRLHGFPLRRLFLRRRRPSPTSAKGARACHSSTQKRLAHASSRSAQVLRGHCRAALYLSLHTPGGFTDTLHRQFVLFQ